MAGLIAKVLSFTRRVKNGAHVSDVKVDRSGGDNATPEHFSSPGEDSFPLTTDYAALMPVGFGSRFVTVGYVDPINEPKALEGEKRIYARDPSDGSVSVEVWLKSDGTAVTENDQAIFTVAPDGAITGENGNGSFGLQADGKFVVNGVEIDTIGKITSPEAIEAPSIIANGKELAGHDHNILSGSSAPGPTGANN